MKKWTSVVFVANDSNSNPNVRMHAFFELWSTIDGGGFSLSEAAGFDFT